MVFLFFFVSYSLSLSFPSPMVVIHHMIYIFIDIIIMLHMMKVRRRHREPKSESDRECLLENESAQHEPSKVVYFLFFLLPLVKFFVALRYVEYCGKLQKGRGKHLKSA